MIEEKDFELGLVAGTAKRIIKQYGIEREPGTIVPNDDAAADKLFEAGLEFATEVGMLCTDTNRRIVWSKDEYLEGLRYCPGEAVLGAAPDDAFVTCRRPEDSTPAMIMGGAYGIEVPEHLFVPLMISYAQEPVIDVLDNPTLQTVYGRSPKASSPWEALGGWREAELSLEAVNRAGRLGMCIGCVELSPTSLGEISATSYGAFRPSDLHHIAAISEFKTNYESLTKLAHLTRTDCHIYGFLASIYGGYFGGAEGIALGLTAAGIVLNQNYLTSVSSLSSVHPFKQCTTTDDILWAFSSVSQALSRNTKLLISSLVRPSGGPGTKTMLYENAAHAIAMTVSGQSFMQSSMSASGTHTKHGSGLDAKIVGEVSHAVLGMTREQGEQIVQALYKRYEATLDDQDVGKPFEDVYDVTTITPTPEWQGIYDQVVEELIDLGVPLDRLQ